MSEKSIFIPARLKSSVINGHVTGAADIIDDALNKTQDVINQEDKEDIARVVEFDYNNLLIRIKKMFE